MNVLVFYRLKQFIVLRVKIWKFSLKMFRFSRKLVHFFDIESLFLSCLSYFSILAIFDHLNYEFLKFWEEIRTFFIVLSNFQCFTSCLCFSKNFRLVLRICTNFHRIKNYVLCISSNLGILFMSDLTTFLLSVFINGFFT